MPKLRKVKQTAKMDLTLSLVIHSVVIGLLVFFAAREGILGDKLKQFAVVIVPKEKPPEPPKQVVKPPEPQKPVEQKKAEQPKPVAAPVQQAPPVQDNVPPPSTLVAAAPEAAIAADFTFSDGAVAVQTTSDPVALFQASVENALKSRWVRPDGIDDLRYVAEVEVSVDATGALSVENWKQMSGNAAWDASVRKVFAQVTSLSRTPPPNFPPSFLVRFDVQEVSEPIAMN
jgi:protein TonB